MSMNLKKLALVVPLVAACAVAPKPSSAIDVTQSGASDEQNAEVRINLSGKLRMLSQRIPSAACHLVRGVDVEASKAIIEGAPAEFSKILAALEFGDADLGIENPEKRRRTLASIEELKSVWTPFEAAANAVAANAGAEAELAYLLNENMSVLGEAITLVEEISSQYSNPSAMTKASAMLIDISGRQRMLTQKMSKESCVAGTNFQTDTTLSDLEGTMKIFEASLEALRFGMPAVGILPPPTSEISQGLEGVASDWSKVKPYLVQAASGADASNDELTQRFQMLNVTMANMNTVVGMYADAAN